MTTGAEWESALTAAIREACGLDVPPSVGFFEAGVTSAMLVAVFERLAHRFGPEVPVTVFFKYPTPRLLARHLAERPARPAATTPAPVATPGPAGWTAGERRDLRARLRQRKG